MRNRRPRMYRHRSNGRNFHRRSNDNDKGRLHSIGFSNGRSKNNFKPHQSAEKLLERYKVLAKEALSSGDKILSENCKDVVCASAGNHAQGFAYCCQKLNLNGDILLSVTIPVLDPSLSILINFPV